MLRHARDLQGEAGEVFAKTLKEVADQTLRADIQESLRTAEILGELAKVSGNPAHQALGYLAEANARYIGLGEYHSALSLYQQAISIYQSLGRDMDQAIAYIGMVGAMIFLGQYKPALEAGEWAGRILEAEGAWFSLARLTSNLSVAYHRLGDDPQALKGFDRAQELYARAGRSQGPGWSRAEFNRAIVLRNLGFFEASMQASRNAAQALDSLGQPVDAARARQSLALTKFILGQYNESLRTLDQVREAFLADGRRRDAVLTDLFISDCLLELGRFEDVLEKCRLVRDTFTELGTRFEVTLARLNEATAFAGLGRYTQALDTLTEARASFLEQGTESWVAYCDIEIASVLLSQGDYARCLDVTRRCCEQFADHPAKKAHAWLIEARALFELSRDEEAQRAVHQSLTIAMDKDIPALTHAGQHLLGRLAERKGDIPAALQHYDRAVLELERLRGRLMIEHRAAYLEGREGVYGDLVAICVTGGEPQKALAYAERAKSRALLDMVTHRLDLSLRARDPKDEDLVAQLQALRAERDRLYRRWESQTQEEMRELDWGTFQEEKRQAQQQVLHMEKRITDLWHRLLVRNADYARDASLWQVRAEPIQPYLDGDTMLVEYFVARDTLYAFSVSREGVQAHLLPGSISQVERLSQLLRLNLRVVPQSAPERIPDLIQNAQGILKKLHGLLIAPLEGVLEGYAKLIVVPHQSLHYLPFHALYDGARYLLSSFQVSYLPGGSFLRYIQAAQPSGEGVLVGAHSSHGRLPYTAREAEQIAALFGVTPFLEEEATLETIEGQAANCRLIHLATHGDFRPDNPLFSGLALENGWLTTLGIFNLRLQASLVTLSACDTGRSVVGGGDELMGLMRAFLSAGAASLVLSLWAVEDESTVQLMRRFYEGLAQGTSIGEALRAAQLEFIQDSDVAKSAGNDAYAHPFFWAPFVVVGNAGPL